MKITISKDGQNRSYADRIMRKEELKLHCLKQINRIAKQAGRLKQEAYDKREFDDCNKYKKIQKELYMLKALSLSTMKEKNEIIELHKVRDENNAILNSYCSADGKYLFHAIAEKQNDSEKKELESISLGKTPDDLGSMAYLPYARFLVGELNERCSIIYEKIMENNFIFYENRASSEFFESLYKFNINALKRKTVERISSTEYLCTLYIDGMKLCDIEIIIFDESEYLVHIDDGKIIIMSFDEYDEKIMEESYLPIGCIKCGNRDVYLGQRYCQCCGEFLD